MEKVISELDKVMGMVNTELSSEYQMRRKVNKDDVRELLERLESEESVIYIDDHNGGKEEVKLQGWALLRNGYICPIIKDTYFCLNPLYIEREDNRIHLSVMSVAGTIISKHHTMDSAINKYNSDLLDYEKRFATKQGKEFKEENYGKVIIAYKMK